VAPADRSAGPVDVAIVGGGVTGCACALRLAEAGKRVRLFEADHEYTRRKRPCR
jgi:2-polyprenyl-6-methoxyphenol hydroxylase-like FAD-dependent oxidoreductase